MARTNRAVTGVLSKRTAARSRIRAAFLCLLLAAAAALAVSCAGPKKLTEQSEKALAQGEVDRAYEKARSALQKAPDNERARRALAAAADRKLDAMKERVRAVAAARDTVAAAGYCLDIDSFRREIAEYRVSPRPDPAFDRESGDIRHVAARALVRDADEELRTGQARAAYANLERARALEGAYPGLDQRLKRAYAQALHRIAILPFQNQTEARGLGTDLTDGIQREVSGRIQEKDLPFTVIIPREEVYAKVTLADAEDLDRSSAVELGRDLDADYVVRGRVYGLTSETTTDIWHPTVYLRSADRDSSGRSVERFAERGMDVVGRTRRVTLRCDYEIRSTRDGSVVAQRSEPMRAVARVIYTGTSVDGDPDDYRLFPPSMRQSDPRGADSRESDWKAHCGSWKLSDFLDRARKEPRRSYRSSYRNEFYSDTESRPVFLADLPPADDLAMVALRDAWRPVLQSIREVER